MSAMIWMELHLTPQGAEASRNRGFAETFEDTRLWRPRVHQRLRQGGRDIILQRSAVSMLVFPYCMREADDGRRDPRQPGL